MGKQPIIEKIQTWLNETYKDSPGYNPIEVTGLPGWDTTNAMLIAYQIEDGVSTSIINNETSSGIYDFTGEGFSPISSSTDFSIQSNKNRLMILQGAFYVKGINPGPFGPTYNPEFSNAVSTLQSNAGIGATGVADLLVVKALLSMDAFTVLPQYGGIAEIAEIQRTLNAQYAYDMGSLIPCDGVYGRDLNKALIYALQIQEGFTAAEANEADGYFGPGTQSKCPTLSLGNANSFVTLLKYALYCNGYTGVDISSDVFDQATQTAIYEVQSFLGLNRTGEAGVDTWMALLLSSGNPNMSVTGCDAAQTLSFSDAQTLKANGYQIVGRYISGEFATSVEELTNILNAGLNVFPIYETGSYQTSYFSAAQGTSDAVAAVEACRNFGIPEGTTIYFTVDYDMEGYQITSLVLPYFEAIYNKFNDAQLNYNIGIYGSRNVCSKVIDAGYAQVAFVDGASTGYSGNMGFPMPKQWAFNQIKEGVTVGGIQVDNDQVSGLDNGFNSLLQNGNEIAVNHTVLTGPNSNNKLNQGLTDFEEFCTFVIQNLLNIKITMKNSKLDNKWYTDPFMFADNNAYIRFDEGFKPQIFNGGYLNLYFDDGEFSFDMLTNGVGSNQIPSEALEAGSSFNKLIKAIIPTGTGFDGYVQFYPYFRPEVDHTLPGYYEFGAEIGVTINEEMIRSYIEMIKTKAEYTPTETDNLLSLIGEYMYIDIIVGIKKDIFKTLNMLVNAGVYELSLLAAKIIELLKLGDISLNYGKSLVNSLTEVGSSLLEAFQGGLETLVDFLSEIAPEFLMGLFFVC